MRVLAIVDTADAHGLSIQFLFALAEVKSGAQVKLVPTTLQGLPSAVTALARSTERLPERYRPDLVVIADLPLTVKWEQTVRQVPKLGKRVLFIDHHPVEEQRQAVLELANRGVIVHVFESALDMNEYLIYLLGEEAGLRLNELERALVLAGAVSDLDCKALRVLGARERELALLLDHLLFTRSALAVSLLLRLIEDRDALERELAEAKRWSSDVLKPDELVEMGRAVECGGKLVLILPMNANEQFASFNRAVAQLTTSGKFDIVMVPVNGVNPRTGEWNTSLLVYAHPCDDVMSIVRRALPNAHVVGHKSFAIALIGTGELSDEKAKALTEQAVREVLDELGPCRKVHLL